jgi:hypothetical protein
MRPLPPTQQTQVPEMMTVSKWHSPSMQDYTFVFGHGPQGTTAVALTDARDTVVAQSRANDLGWYVISVKSSEYTTVTAIAFLGSSGHTIGSQQL